MVDLPSCSVEWVVLVVLMLLKVCPCCPWKQNIFASFLERVEMSKRVRSTDLTLKCLVKAQPAALMLVVSAAMSL